MKTAAEGDAAFLDVRTRDIQLERGDAFDVRKNARELDVLLQRRAADVHDDGGTPGTQLRHLFGDEPVDADSLEADGIQHAGGGLHDAGRRVSFALGKEETLYGDAAERRQIDQVGVFGAVPETTARGDERVFQRQRADGNREVHVHQLISLARKTGPARQARTKCGLPSGVLIGITQL